MLITTTSRTKLVAMVIDTRAGTISLHERYPPHEWLLKIKEESLMSGTLDDIDFVCDVVEQFADWDGVRFWLGSSLVKQVVRRQLERAKERSSAVSGVGML